MKTFPAGRMNEAPSVGLSASLRDAGFKLGRLQTGTPARLDKSTINFADPRFEIQPGNENPGPFSFMNKTVDNAVRTNPYRLNRSDVEIGQPSKLLQDMDNGGDTSDYSG